MLHESKLVLLSLSRQAVQGHSCGCCSSSALASVRLCQSVVPKAFLQHPWLQHSWDGVQSSQKGEALPLPLPSLVFPAAQNLGLPILLGDPKFRHLLTWDSPSSWVSPNSPL